MSDIRKCILNLKKVHKIKDSQKIDLIHSYYRDMIIFNEEGRKSLATSYYNTLLYAGYIIDYDTEKRNKKLKKLL